VRELSGPHPARFAQGQGVRTAAASAADADGGVQLARVKLSVARGVLDRVSAAARLS